MSETLADRIQQRLEKLGLSEQAASLKATGKKDTIRMIRLGRSQSPRIETIDALAVALDTTQHWLLYGDEAKTSQITREVSDPVPLPNVRDMPRDVPVYGTASGSVLGGKSGAMQMTADPVDYVRRPPGLAQTRDAYALYIENISMSPRYEPGDLVYVHPARPPRPGDFVIVQVQNSEVADMETYIKRLKRRSSTQVTCEQFTPAADVNFDLKTVRALHRVMTTSEIMAL